MVDDGVEAGVEIIEEIHDLEGSALAGDLGESHNITAEEYVQEIKTLPLTESGMSHSHFLSAIPLNVRGGSRPHICIIIYSNSYKALDSHAGLQPGSQSEPTTHASLVSPHLK